MSIIDRFVAVFGEPRVPDPALFLVEYRRALVGLDAGVLDKVADVLICKSTFWPKPAEVLELASGILADRDRRAAASRPGTSLTRQMVIANRLIQCDLGRRAADDGWVRQLWDFCCAHGRLPGEYEIGKLIASSREHDALVADLARKPTALIKGFLNLAASMQERGKQLGEIADGARQHLTPMNVKWG